MFGFCLHPPGLPDSNGPPAVQPAQERHSNLAVEPSDYAPIRLSDVVAAAGKRLAAEG